MTPDISMFTSSKQYNIENTEENVQGITYARRMNAQHSADDSLDMRRRE